jgi:hypothetical protein
MAFSESSLPLSLGSSFLLGGEGEIYSAPLIKYWWGGGRVPGWTSMENSSELIKLYSINRECLASSFILI